MGADAPRRDAAFSSVCTDTRKLKPGQLFFALSGEHFDGNAFADAALEQGAAAVVTQRQDPARQFLSVPDPLAALQRFAGWHRQQLGTRIIAITGSAGKTTAKNFTAALLETKYRVVKTQGNLNNHIGAPLSLLELDEGTERMVLELGADHVGEIASLCAFSRPDESAITLVAPSHLEGFGSLERIGQAKAEIAQALPADGVFYVNMDNPWCVKAGELFPGNKVRFGEGEASGAQGLDVALRRSYFDEAGELVLEIDPIGKLVLPLPIRAHATNVLLAVAIGLQHGITEFEAPLRAACASAARFKVRAIGPITVLDDTYNANPASMAAALRALGERPGNGQRLAALGEMLELGAESACLHGEIGAIAAACGISHLFARGPHACDTIHAAIAANLPHAEVIQDHGAIANAIYDAVKPGDTVLVKGSRGMTMEKVIDALAELYAAEG